MGVLTLLTKVIVKNISYKTTLCILGLGLGLSHDCTESISVNLR
jgi:hypothetical protein